MNIQAMVTAFDKHRSGVIERHHPHDLGPVLTPLFGWSMMLVLHAPLCPDADLSREGTSWVPFPPS